MPEFSELRVLNCRSTCVRKNADSSARILRLGLRIENLFTAICANLKGCLLFLGNLLRRVLTIVRPQTALFQQLTIYAPDIGNRPGGRCAASRRKTSKIPQAFHRLWNKSCGPGQPTYLRPSNPQLFRGRCSSVCHRLEPCGTLQEGHADGPGWPVALLADKNLGHSLQLWLVGFVDFFTEDKGDDVRLLLD